MWFDVVHLKIYDFGILPLHFIHVSVGGSKWGSGEIIYIKR